MPVCLLAAAAMPAFPASGILRQSDATRHAGRFPQRSARTESEARFVQLERIWLMAIKPSLPLIQSDRKSVVEGKSVSVRVDLGGGRIINKKESIHIKI